MDEPAPATAVPSGVEGAWALVARHERSVPPTRRRRHGVHYTPAALAARLVGEAVAVLGRVPATVLDPSCGAGAFLLAAADELHRAGVPAAEVVERRLVGIELDPAAAAAARSALREWAAAHGAGHAGTARILSGDARWLGRDWAERPPGGFDLVVGNPPFLSQLSRRTARSAVDRERARERFGAAFGYADAAALFLAGAMDLVAEGGVVAMLQPQSVLAARDTTPVRELLAERGELVALWVGTGRPFEAEVDVCAPVLRAGPRSSTAAPGGTVRVVAEGPSGAATHRVALPPAASWAPLLAPVHGLPDLPAAGSAAAGALGDLASATAGFRDEYYALRDAAVEGGSPSDPRLVTVGMVEPGWSRWGERPARLGGRRYTCPRVDLGALAAASPRVAAWATRRLVPKVLVATQTRVVEAAVDAEGDVVPVTPLISVEPHPGVDPWMVAAALLAPPVSVSALASHLGLGLSPGTLRWSASAVLDQPLPADRELWEAAAERCRALAAAEPERRGELLVELGGLLCRAHGMEPDGAAHRWWVQRLGRRR